MTIKRRDISAWLDRECTDKAASYFISFTKGGVRVGGLLKLGSRFATRIWFIHSPNVENWQQEINDSDEADLSWSDVLVSEVVFSVGGQPYFEEVAYFTPPPRTVTLEVDAEKWEALKNIDPHRWSAALGSFVYSAKVK